MRLLAKIKKSGTSESLATCASDGSDYLLEVSVLNGMREIYTNGCPFYDWTSQTTPNQAVINPKLYEVSAQPIVCTSPTVYIGVYTDLNETTLNSNPVMQAVGVSYDGVAIYSNSDSLSRDAYVYESNSFDECDGHPDVDGTYHYHAQVPDSCLLVAPIAGVHSDLYGFMADGIPIYGIYGDNGTVPTDLDDCNGHTDETYSFYHYHMTANYTYPYTVNCLMGQVDTTKWTNFDVFASISDCVEADVQYDYSSILDAWVTSSSSSSGNISPSVTSSSGLSALSVIGVVILILVSYFLYQQWKAKNRNLHQERQLYNRV